MVRSLAYRIEFHQAHRLQTLDIVTHATPHRRSLDPFYSHLLREGQWGWLVLVEVDSRTVVARRRVGPPGAAHERRRAKQAMVP